MSRIGAQEDTASGLRPVGDPEWLSPTQALTRFRLSADPSADPARTPDQRVRYGFRVGALNLLVKPRTASEVIGMPPITAIPKGPPWLLGMINLRSDLVPVFDLALICALDRRQGADRRILVLDKGEDAVALLIDGLPTAPTRLSPLQHLPSLPTALRGAVAGGYAAGDDIWLEFEHRAFFGSLTEATGDKGG